MLNICLNLGPEITKHIVTYSSERNVFVINKLLLRLVNVIFDPQLALCRDFRHVISCFYRFYPCEIDAPYVDVIAQYFAEHGRTKELRNFLRKHSLRRALNYTKKIFLEKFLFFLILRPVTDLSSNLEWYFWFRYATPGL